MENRIIEAFKRAVISVPDRKIIAVFKKAASAVPAYKKILSEKALQPKNIKTLEDFSKMVPVLYKKDLFEGTSPEDLCMPGAINSLATAIVTSGTSGAFAYKAITKRAQKSEKKMIDGAFKLFFNASIIALCSA